jgi:hypothetical protein
MPPMPFASRLRLGFAASCAGLALAAPAAHAQSGGAGDNQYADPFPASQATPTATPRATATPAPAAPAATAAPAPAAAGATATPAPAPATSASSGPTLPYTGVDAWIPGLSGALLLGAGVALRVRLREPD